MKFAAIDIGSNGARMQISSVLHDEGITRLKKVEYVRFPLRLGHDVFTEGRISPMSEDRMIKLMLSYQLLMELHEVEDYMACATSAMREAENGYNVVVKSLSDGQYLHIDVGGGSTELNLYQDRTKIIAKSFKLGSVRLLEGKESKTAFQKMQEWIVKYVDHSQPIEAVGTGGNINKLFDLSSKLTESSTSLDEILRMRDYISQFTLAERINKLQLNPDRADVIVPAGDIYTSAMKWAGATVIHVPDVGLKDGMLQLLYDRACRKKRA